MYYGAKMVIHGDKLTDIAKRIINGITVKSNRMGIQNFLYLFGKSGGLSSTSKMMRDIYNNLQKIEKTQINYPDEVEGNEELYKEGRVKQVFINTYERDAKARQECIDLHGCQCFFCNFDFEKEFGDLGKGFIHVHHIKPLSEVREEYQPQPSKDLVPVCPNCHAMIHRGDTPTTIEAIKEKLQSL